MAVRRRLDAEVVRRHLAGSRSEAQHLIDAGRVLVNGSPATKSASMITPGDAIVVESGGDPGWASRAGGKLDAALVELDLDVRGRRALDAGAAHGGFTDVLLRRGVASVVAVDVAYGQLDWRLRSDPRVTVLERTNVRYLTPADVPGTQPDFVVGDLSFISLRLVLPALRAVAVGDAVFVLLVKPQFEAGRGSVGKGGVVRDPTAWRRAMTDVSNAAGALGLSTVDAVVSQVPGPAGNIEFFLHLHQGHAHDAAEAIERAVDRGQALAGRG